jgi:hypothetical protein
LSLKKTIVIRQHHKKLPVILIMDNAEDILREVRDSANVTLQAYFPKKVKGFLTKLAMNLLRGAERRKCFRFLFRQLTVFVD